MKFTKGNTDPIGDCGNFAAGLDVEGWGNRIEVYGSTPADAEALRDEFIKELSELAALREELAVKVEAFEMLGEEYGKLYRSFQKTIDLLSRAYGAIDDFPLAKEIKDALKPTESGASE